MSKPYLYLVFIIHSIEMMDWLCVRDCLFEFFNRKYKCKKYKMKNIITPRKIRFNSYDVTFHPRDYTYHLLDNEWMLLNRSVSFKCKFHPKTKQSYIELRTKMKRAKTLTASKIIAYFAGGCQIIEAQCAWKSKQNNMLRRTTFEEYEWFCKRNETK